MRGTFANVRLRTLLADKEGGFTTHFPDGEQTTIYDAAMSYAEDGVPLVVLGGKEYGSGSSRDWAAKGTRLLGVRAVIAESFERIHRSNLIGMGVLPLQFADGDSADSLGLTGEETFDVSDLDEGKAKTVEVTTHRDGGEESPSRRRSARYPERGRLLPKRRHPAQGASRPERLAPDQGSSGSPPGPAARRSSANLMPAGGISESQSLLAVRHSSARALPVIASADLSTLACRFDSLGLDQSSSSASIG